MKIYINSHRDILSNLTIIIPTYKRPDEVLKTISFWQDRGPKLLVLDGSPNPIKDEHLKFGGKDLTYVHLPVSMRLRLIKSIEFISTAYIALSGDDEVQMPSSLVASIKELEENPDLISCLGWAVGFSKSNGHSDVREIIGYPCYPRLQFLENTQTSVRSRLIKHFSHYVPSNIYSVLRTEAYGNVLKVLSMPGETVGGQLELEFELATIFQGGNRVLPNLHWLRNFGDSGNYSHEADANQKKKFYDCFLSPKFALWKEEFLSTRAQVLSEIGGHDSRQVRAWLEEAFQLYSELCLDSIGSFLTVKGKLTSFYQARIYKPLIWLVGLMIEKQKNMLKFILRRPKQEVSKPISLLDMVEILSNKGLNYSREEFEEVSKKFLEI